jgi:crotonobetainyl-CoA:carnitine CoA-transferase CaiB-like acyl-CoA transferase
VALGDLGADVIKIETPAGDPNRNIFRSFAAVNRGKRSLAIDMKKPEAREIIERLCASADIILNNFRPGVSARLGIDPATLRARDPDKICLESTGYGRTGPKGDQPGFDMVFQAFCGLEDRAGGKGNDPVWSRTSMVDYCQGLMNSIAALAATYNRLRGGSGADLESTLLGAGMFLVSDHIRLPDGDFAGPAPLNHSQTGMHPAEALYQAADGWIAIAAVDEGMAGALVDTLGIAAACDPSRAAWGDREGAAIAAAILPHKAADLLDRLSAAGVWTEPCIDNGATILDDPSKSYVATTRHSQYGAVRQIGPLFRMSGNRVTAKPSLPDIGSDTRQILRDLGYDDARIAEFYEAKVVA